MSPDTATRATPKMVDALGGRNTLGPPVWFPRQAGRYQASYRALRDRHSFVELCTTPALAARLALAAVEEFDFDAAIVFSDILFALEALGLPLEMDPAPRLPRPILSLGDLEELLPWEAALPKLAFQWEAMELLRRSLPAERAAFGFSGGPATLFRYACGGSHLADGPTVDLGLFTAFAARLVPLLAALLTRQAEAGADALLLFDTSAGLYGPDWRRAHWRPAMAALRAALAERAPATPVILYARGLDFTDRKALSAAGYDGFGLDETQDLPAALGEGSWAIQGNLPPAWLALPPAEFEERFDAWAAPIQVLPPRRRRGWIASLGHGVPRDAREETVRLAVKRLKALAP